MDEPSTSDRQKANNGEALASKTVSNPQKAGNHEREPQKQSTNNKPKSLWEQLKVIPMDRRVELILAFAVAIASIAYSVVAGITLCEIKRTSDDTHTLAEQAKSQLTLQKQIVRFLYGAHVGLAKDWLGTYKSQKGRIWANVGFENFGNFEGKGSDITSVCVAIKAEVRIADPTFSEYPPKDVKFLDTTNADRNKPSTTIHLRPSPGPLPVSDNHTVFSGNRTFENIRLENAGDQKLYVWGTIQYTDYIGDPKTMNFCRWVLGKYILDNRVPFTTFEHNKHGYSGPYNNCDQPEPYLPVTASTK